MEFNIQYGSQNSPELAFQLNKLLARMPYVSQFIQKLLRITGPPFIKERRLDLTADWIGMMDSNMIQKVVAWIGLMG